MFYWDSIISPETIGMVVIEIVWKKPMQAYPIPTFMVEYLGFPGELRVPPLES